MFLPYRLAGRGSPDALRSLAQHGELVRVRGPKKLSFDELVKLATLDPPPQELQEKLDRLLNEPFLSNEATFEGAKPNAPFVKELGTLDLPLMEPQLTGSSTQPKP